MTAWQEIRVQVLKRDNRQCQSCGKRTVGQVHHIIPCGLGGASLLSNLMTLCGKCHMLVSPVPNWVIRKVWRISLRDIERARETVHDNIRKYELNKRTLATSGRNSADSDRNQAKSILELKRQVTWLNAYLSAVYNCEMRLSTLLAKVGFDSKQIQVIRDKNLEPFVNSFISSIKDRMLAYTDGERLFTITSRRLELDGKASETLQSLGERLGISRERVRQLENKALRRCRHKVNKMFLESRLRDLAQRQL